MDIPDFVPNEPAPPPYTDQEFDSKVNLTIEVSLVNPQPEQISQQHSQSQNHGADAEEEWERWDEEAFRAAEQSLVLSQRSSMPPRNRPLPDPHLTTSSGSRTPAGQPLNTQRRHVHPSPKERPAWFDDAHLRLPSQIRPSSSPLNSPAPTFEVYAAQTSSQITPNHNYDPDISDLAPPPPFAPVGPSLDGPAYSEETNPDSYNYTTTRPITRDSRGSYSDSPPSSPLLGPTPASSEDVLGHSPSSSHFHRFSTPSISPFIQSAARQTPRTISAFVAPPRPAFSKPVAPFEPVSAYQGARNTSLHGSAVYSTPAVDVSAFYNSSISSVLSPNKLRDSQSRSAQGQGLETSSLAHSHRPITAVNMHDRVQSSLQSLDPSIHQHSHMAMVGSQANDSESCNYPTSIQSLPLPSLPPGAQQAIQPQYRSSNYAGWNM